MASCAPVLEVCAPEAADSHMEWRERGTGTSRAREKSEEALVRRNEADLRDLVRNQ